MNIKINSTISEVNDVMVTSNEFELTPFSVSNTVKVKSMRKEVVCKNIAEAFEALGHIIIRGVVANKISIDDITSAINFKTSDIAGLGKKLLAGKYRPGVTKVGFGPLHVMNILEEVNSANDLLGTVKAFLLIASLQPFVTIVGIESFVVNVNETEFEINDDQLNNCIKTIQLLDCFKAVINMCGMKKVPSTEFFTIEAWVIFVRELKNILAIEADKVELFEEAIDSVSVLLAAQKLGISNKALILYQEVLNDNDAKALMECDQIIARGMKEITTLPTILASALTLDRLRFNIKTVFGALNGSSFIENTPFEIRDGSIYVFEDKNLKGHTRGGMLIGSPYVEQPIQALKKLESSKSYYSYSNEGFANLGKTFTDAANSLYESLDSKQLTDVVDVKYYALNKWMSNLEEADMRKLLIKIAPYSVHVYVPANVKDTASDLLKTAELNKIQFYYTLTSPTEVLEYESATGFKVLGSVVLKKPFLPLMRALNKNHDKIMMYKGIRDKTYFPKYSYDMCILREVTSFTYDNKSSNIEVDFTVGSWSTKFTYNSRDLLGLSVAGTYYLDSASYAKKVEEAVDIRGAAEGVIKQAYKDLFGSTDKEEKFEEERKFMQMRQVITDNPFLVNLARKVRKSVMQGLIDDDGSFKETESMSTIIEAMNKALIEVIEKLIKTILNKEFKVSTAISSSDYMSREYLGGNHEIFI